MKKTSVKDPHHFLILLRKTSGAGYVLTVRSTYFAASSVNFFFGFQEYDREGYHHEFRRKKIV
jgi:hypothetical protein